MGKITINELHNSLFDYVQTVSDNKLETNNKTIVGAINELFSDNSNDIEINNLKNEISNGKKLIASAIGEPLSSDQTFQAMSTDINGLLSTFKTNMMNNGVTVESGDKFKSLIDKIATLADNEGNKVQFVTGFINNTTYLVDEYTTRTWIKNSFTFDSSLDFTPTRLILSFPMLGLSQSVNDRYYLDNYTVDSQMCYDKNNYFHAYESNCNSSIELYITNISNTGFDLYANKYTEYYPLVCPEGINWLAIGVGEEDTTLRDSLASILQDEGVEVTPEDDMASLITKVDEEFDRKNTNSGLDIISATELPSEVVNNQIVLISNIDPTAVEIKDSSLCNPSVEGMVNVGTTSTNNGKYCTIAKDNITVLLYLIRALQYVNGSAKQLSAYVGIDGSWVQFSWAGLYAFISGAYENSNLFGTFTNAATSSTLYSAYPPEISGNNVKIGQTSSSSSYDESGYYKGNALYYFTTKINCTNYSKLKITVSNYSKTNVSTGYIHFGIKQANNTYFNSSTDKYIEIKKTGTYEVDLSSYNSTGYIAAYIFSNSYSSTKNCSAYVYISSIELMP